MADMGATTISWLNSTDDWLTFPIEPVTPIMEMGKGYVIELPAPLNYIFTGEPGAMIKYTESWGFPAGSLVTASVVGNNVELNWPSLGPGIEYYVVWSETRDGFFTFPPSQTILNGGQPVADTSYIDVDSVIAAGEDYYLIVPYDPVEDANGSSTYSIGVFMAEYNGNEFFGLPLKPVWGDMSADWYVDQIRNSLGIVYLEGGIWKAHFKEFPEGVYDTTIVMGRGYELSVNDTTLYTYIGW
jgi:hypothetical protein